MFTKKIILISIIGLFVLSGLVIVGQDYINLRKRVYEKSYTTKEVDNLLEFNKINSDDWASSLSDNNFEGISDNRTRIIELEKKINNPQNNSTNSYQERRNNIVNFCQSYDSLEYKTQMDKLTYKNLC